MFTFNTTLFIQFLTSLESLRRGQAGALMMGMFITQDTTTRQSALTRIAQLRFLAELVSTIIDELPPFVSWAATPFMDYSRAIL